MSAAAPEALGTYDVAGSPPKHNKDKERMLSPQTHGRLPQKPRPSHFGPNALFIASAAMLLLSAIIGLVTVYALKQQPTISTAPVAQRPPDSAESAGAKNDPNANRKQPAQPGDAGGRTVKEKPSSKESAPSNTPPANPTSEAAIGSTTTPEPAQVANQAPTDTRISNTLNSLPSAEDAKKTG